MSDEPARARGEDCRQRYVDTLRDGIGYAAERLTELKVGALTGAAPGEKSASRPVQRTGNCDRDRETRTGAVELRIPRLRKSCYFPRFAERRAGRQRDAASA